MAETSLDTLILLIARRLGAATGGLSTSGTTTTLVDTAALFEPDSTWIGHYIRFLSGANVNQERLIIASSQSAKSVTFDPSVSVAVASAVGYQITPMRYQLYLDAIFNAIASAGDSWVVMKDDATSITFNGNQEYSLPSDVLMLHQVWYGDGQFWDQIGTWEVLGTPGAYKLHFRDFPIPFSDMLADGTNKIRLIYAASPPILNSPSQTLTMGGTADRQVILYLQEMALYYLHTGLWSKTAGEQARSHMSQAQQHHAEALRLKASRTPIPGPTSIRARRIAGHI